MTHEYFPQQEYESDRLLKIKEAEGWHLVGREKLTQTRFSKGARFVEVPYQTEESIKDKYLRQVKQEDPYSEFEVELVLDENTDKLKRIRKISTEEEYRHMIATLPAEDRTYLVFIRRRLPVPD